MRVTDEMVEAAVRAFSAHDQGAISYGRSAMTAALEAALSHAAGQEGDDSLPRPLWPVSKEWYRLCERRFAVDRITISGKLAEAIVEAVCAAPPTTSAEVGRDAERYRLLRDRTLKKSVSDGRDDGPFIATGNILRGFSVPRYPDLEIDQALAASSGRQGWEDDAR